MILQRLKDRNKFHQKNIREAVTTAAINIMCHICYAKLFTCFLTTAMAPFKNYERLSELVKMHPCLFKKYEKEFKKEEAKQRAWQEIARQLNVENEKIMEQH